MIAPEPTPFAWVDEGDFDKCELPSMDIGGIVHIEPHEDADHVGALESFRREAAMLNAAVQRERQAAAVKALWDAADALDAVLGEAAKFDPASHWLRGRAEAMQYIASRAERAERGDHA